MRSVALLIPLATAAVAFTPAIHRQPRWKPRAAATASTTMVALPPPPRPSRNPLRRFQHFQQPRDFGVEKWRLTNDYSTAPLPARSEIAAWRAGVAAGAMVLAAAAPWIDRSVLPPLWSCLQQAWWFRADMFEPAVATTSFVIWIKLWHGIDWLAFGGTERARQAAANGELPAPRGLGARFPGLRRYRLQDRASPSGIAKPNKWYGASTLVGGKEGRRVYVPEWLQEMFLYVAPIALIATFTDAFAPRRAALAMGAPTVGRIAFDIAGALFLYDTYFFISHLALHKLPAKLYHWTHGKHHVNRDCRASDTVRLTPVEEFADVMCSILALRTMGAHPLSRGLYNFVIVGMLVELHAGYDMPFSLQNLVPFGIMGGSRRHHEHHRSGRSFYQKFFTCWDELFGFGDRGGKAQAPKAMPKSAMPEAAMPEAARSQ